MAEFIDTVTGHSIFMVMFLGGAITLWWTGFPGPEEVPIGLWSLGMALAGRITAKAGDSK